MKTQTSSDISEAKLSVPVGKQDHIQGRGTAPNVLIEYGDYECPYCGEAHLVVKALQKRMGDNLCFVFRNFPLTEMHPHSEHAAEEAEAADKQGKFWEMHDLLFENQDALEDEDLAAYAEQLGLDARRVIREVETSAYSERIRDDFLSGVRSGVNGTPCFFINGVRHDGAYDLESLLAAFGK